MLGHAVAFVVSTAKPPPPDGEVVIVSARCASGNDALTACAWFIVRLHVAPVPEHPGSPVQPPNVESAPADSASVTAVPYAYEHVAVVVPFDVDLEQPVAGVGVTDTVPLPVHENVSVCAPAENVAVTSCSCVITTVHWFGFDALAVQPVQPANDATPLGVAVSVTVVPYAIDAVHDTLGQLMPPMLDVTAPDVLALPAGVTLRTCGPLENVTVAVAFAVSVIVHVVPFVDVQPDQVAVAPLAGAAVSTTVVSYG